MSEATLVGHMVLHFLGLGRPLIHLAVLGKLVKYPTPNTPLPACSCLVVRFRFLCVLCGAVVCVLFWLCLPWLCVFVLFVCSFCSVWGCGSLFLPSPFVRVWLAAFVFLCVLCGVVVCVLFRLCVFVWFVCLFRSFWGRGCLFVAFEVPPGARR